MLLSTEFVFISCANAKAKYGIKSIVESKTSDEKQKNFFSRGKKCESLVGGPIQHIGLHQQGPKLVWNLCVDKGTGRGYALRRWADKSIILNPRYSHSFCDF